LSKLEGDEWFEFKLVEKGCKVNFPDIPKQNKRAEAMSSESEQKILWYEVQNEKAYYSLQVRDVSKTNYIENDTADFAAVKEKLIETGASISSFSIII
jgi:hypothetical protein